MEERSVFRRWTIKTARVGLNVSAPSLHFAAGILPGDAPSDSRDVRVRGRVSARKLGCACFGTESLDYPMPPRTTPESSRPRVSDRTMVANLTIATLVGFEPRMASSLIMSMKPLRRGTRCLDEDARGPRPSTARRNPAEGLDARKHPRRPASGEKYLLTSPFIGLPVLPTTHSANRAAVLSAETNR